jgi:PAS domain-containing protein
MRAGRAMDPATGDMAPAALLGALLDAPDDAVVGRDRDGRVVSWNRAAGARMRESEAPAHVDSCLWERREV